MWRRQEIPAATSPCATTSALTLLEADDLRKVLHRTLDVFADAADHLAESLLTTR
ncbi:hypothetical protein ACIBQ1_15840 [Nonomuraea sp. NPDC050153]|uniref:hypothetical protein n=1 Tax=Nonomuraea sp. NPDC050153 TaxID=3364359 RepID=UPI0037A73FBF